MEYHSEGGKSISGIKNKNNMSTNSINVVGHLYHGMLLRRFFFHFRKGTTKTTRTARAARTTTATTTTSSTTASTTTTTTTTSWSNWILEKFIKTWKSSPIINSKRLGISASNWI
ncbi:hypothetical protein FHG87_022075 [Trinorchestia longiramus]|nr:hypothetical protein FHG87_022075 [Trinorchestia longiramus]